MILYLVFSKSMTCDQCERKNVRVLLLQQQEAKMDLVIIRLIEESKFVIDLVLIAGVSVERGWCEEQWNGENPTVCTCSCRYPQFQKVRVA